MRENSDIIHKSRQDQWHELIISPLLSTDAQRQQCIILIDALDECSSRSDIEGIIRTLTRHAMQVPGLRIVITSRPETPIHSGFNNDPAILHWNLSLDDVPQHVIDSDLKTFFVSRFEALRRKLEGLPKDWPGQDSLDVLVRQSGGLFIYAATICRYLEADCLHTSSRLEDVLSKATGQGRSYSEALDNMYLTVLSTCIGIPGEFSDSEKAVARKLFTKVIGSLIILQDNLTIEALACLTKIERFRITLLLAKLRSIVKYSRQGPVTLLHETLREFISDRQRCKDMRFLLTPKQHMHSFWMIALRLYQLTSNETFVGCMIPELPWATHG